MLQYFIRRFLIMLPKLLIITILIFIGMELLPGDAITRSLNPEAFAHITPEQLEALRESAGLNDPAFIRYIRWLGCIITGNFGYSSVSGSSISSLLIQRMPATFELALFSLVLSTLLGLLFGFISAVRQRTVVDYANTALGMIGISVPDFFLGMTFILIFAIQLHWLPSGGRMTLGKEAFLDRIEYLLMPALCLGIQLIATLMRYTRNSMLDVMNKDYIKTARAKGLGERAVYLRHCFRNGCTPVMMLLIGRLSMLIGGTAIIESVFSFPGMGSLLMSSMTTSDIPVAMTILLLVSVSVLATCFLADIFLAILDPRIRFGKE